MFQAENSALKRFVERVELALDSVQGNRVHHPKLASLDVKAPSNLVNAEVRLSVRPGVGVYPQRK